MDRVLFEEQGATSVMLPGYKNPRTKQTEFQHPTQDEIDVMETDLLARSINLWMTFKRCGLPHGNGWFDGERATVIDIINILESESNRYDSWEMKHRDELPDEDDEE
jgi:hypothetical protein